MKRIADGLCQLAGKFVELGLDGILYAGLGGERFLFTDQEFEEYIMPFDKQIMKACWKREDITSCTCARQM